MTTTTALIAEDEPLLAAHLQSELARLWPDLQVVARVGDGQAAAAQALALQPDLLFLDIRMPGMSGLEAAQAIAEDWPDDAKRPFPLIVFVTAYDQYALQAFEHAAVDYVLKPVQPDRLAQTCTRLQAALARRAQPAPDAPPALDAVMQQLRGLIAGTAATAEGAPRLRVIQAGAGNAIHMVPVDEVLYFEAADKYVRVITASREHLIRTSLRELQPQLDPQRFWQIHRGTIVRCDAIDTVLRDETGRFTLALRGHADKLVVSRLYAHLFKAM
ncbi:MAG TPA: LytTR family DNA-binding domain-containing protein [Albitalea sp.]|uniref:LytR/AlgR family response regulator transcription factor n=1 Tax=Piscinibacter sp. TaxID=1903157 RepID=UPI002ED289DC